MSSSSKILSVDQLSISFDDFVAVDNLTFELHQGKVLAVVGESGSGKSLTALSLIGLLPKGAIQKGEVEFAGEQMNSSSWSSVRGDDVGMVFQEPMSSLNPVMKVGKQVSESILLHQKVTRTEAKAQTIRWFEKVKLPEPEKIYDRYTHELSGGQKQRVMIAMAMCNKPKLLIADEPTTALDVTVQQEVVDLMKQLQEEEGTALIFITHDLALAAKIADDILVMQNGKNVEYGNAIQVLKQPNADYTKALLASRPSASDKGKRLFVVEDFLNGTNLEEQATFKNTITEEALLKVNNLKVWFEQKSGLLKRNKSYYKAVDNVSFELKKGEVLGLVGESGCGKSTLSKSIIGLLPIKQGEVFFQNEDLAKYSQKEWKQIRKEIQLIFQDPYASLNPRMTVGDMLKEPLAIHNVLPRLERSSEAKRLLDIVGLPSDSMKRYAHQFSGGQRQRIGIARALAVRPQLLICDESVSALDVSVQAQILNLLKDIQEELSLSYLFISHDLNVVHYISDRVMVMQNGKLVEVGKAEQVLQYPEHDYTKKLINAMP